LPEISVSPVLGKFLYMLAKLSRAHRILEIGTLGGYSAIWLGRALPEDGRLLTLEIDPLHARIARRNLARAMLLGTAEVREGPAPDLLANLVAAGEEAFDLIFIDADKEAYLEYFDFSLKLSRPGTLIVADNVIRYGAVIDAHAGQSDSRVAGIQRFLDALAKHPGVEATIIQSVGVKGHDGLALAIVK
jgi:caffeoyl-CoA O-methyltransferase